MIGAEDLSGEDHTSPNVGIMAVGVGFEPTEPRGSPVFKTGAFDHSATPPSRDARGSGRGPPGASAGGGDGDTFRGARTGGEHTAGVDRHEARPHMGKVWSSPDRLRAPDNLLRRSLKRAAPGV